MRIMWPFRHLGLKLLSLGLAVSLWMVVSGEATVERGLRVPLEFQQFPAGLELQGDAGKALAEFRPGDAPAKGKIERLWRTLRGHVLDRLDLQEVTTVEELNLRLWSYVEAEYHTRPHASLSGKTPLEVWETDSDQIRWVSDHSELEAAFYGEVERMARHDSTVQWRGIHYEIPPHLRRQKIRLRYSLLDPQRVSVIEANVETPVRVVQPVDNAQRSRAPQLSAPAAPEKPSTGLNAPELLLDHLTGRKSSGGHHGK